MTFLFAWLILVLAGSAQAEINRRSYGNIEIGSSKYLLFDKANLRKEPATTAAVVQNLPVGSLFKVKAASDRTFKLNGYDHYWYEVALLDKNNKETGVTGFLWGGFFAEDSYKSKNDPGVYFLYGVAKYNEEEKTLSVQIRAVLDNRELARLNFQALGSLSTGKRCEVMGNKGLRNVTDILHFSFRDEYCGGAFGDVYVFWDKAVLHLAKTLHSGSDAPVFSTESFTFPDDAGGKEGRIIFYEDAGENGDTGKVYDYQRKTDFIWTGCELQAAQ